MANLFRTKVNDSINLVREVSDVDSSLLEGILTSPYLGEGVYGFEVLYQPDKSSTLVITPSTFREDIGSEAVRDFNFTLVNRPDILGYKVVLSKPSFLPLFTSSPSSLLQDIADLDLEGGVLLQFLFSQVVFSDRKKHNYIDQYSAYLQGIDFPVQSYWGRSFQGRLLSLLNRITGYRTERDFIDEIEHKILGRHYEFELRLLTFPKDVGDTTYDKVSDLVSNWSYFNELKVIPVKKDRLEPFIGSFVSFKMSNSLRDQIIGDREMFALLSEGETEQVSLPATLVDSVQPELRKSVAGVSLLPLGELRERHIDEDIFDSIPSALYRTKSVRKGTPINILGAELGATMQRVSCEIPKGTNFTEITRKLEDIKAVMGTDLNIVRGEDPNTLAFLVPCSEREIIYLRSLLEDPRFVEFAKNNPLPFICGVDLNNEPIYKCLTKAPHLLVAGATNSGKSVFLNSLLITLILFRSPQELRLFLIDPKRVELEMYNGFSHVDKVVVEMQEAFGLLENLVAEMENRYKILAEKGSRNIESYNIQNPKEKLPFVVCAIDEYNDLRMAYPDVEDLIKRLGQKARASGIHLIIATQRPDKEVMSGVIKTNLPSRIAFKLEGSNEYRTVFGRGIPYKNLLGFGDGVVKYLGQTEDFVRFQAPIVSLNQKEEEKTFEKIKSLHSGESVSKIEFEELPVVPVEEPLDRLREIITDTRETRTKELQQAMGIRINDVVELRSKLVDEGFLTKDGRSFVVNEQDTL